MDDAVAQTLLAHLRRIAPHKVRVFDSSDEYRDIAVPTRRKRWTQVIDTIEARPWVRAELMNKKDEILGYVENAGPAGPLEDIGAKDPPGAAQGRWLLDMMIKAQTTALTFRDKEHGALLQGIRDMMEVMTGAMRETVGLMREQRDIVAETAAIRAAAEKGDDLDQIVKLVEASPKLMSQLGPLFQLLRPRLPPAPSGAPKNGAPPPKGAAK